MLSTSRTVTIHKNDSTLKEKHHLQYPTLNPAQHISPQLQIITPQIPFRSHVSILL